jgi:3-oxoacyl-[acyl-carrier-protein] synthase-3
VNVYVTSTGAFLPGPPVDNTEIEHILGFVEGKPSRLKARILKSNGIQTRHYAIDRAAANYALQRGDGGQRCEEVSG